MSEATNSSGIPVLHEVVNENDNALMFPVAGAGVLSEQLTLLIRDPALRERMSSNSLKNFRAKFKIDKINAEMLHFYKQVSR